MPSENFSLKKQAQQMLIWRESDPKTSIQEHIVNINVTVWNHLIVTAKKKNLDK